MLLFSFLSFLFSCLMFLINNSEGQNFGPFQLAKPLGKQPALTYDVSLPQVPQNDQFSIWETFQPFKKQIIPQGEIWYPEGQIPQQNKGFMANVYRGIINFLLSFIPAPIRYFLGWY
ncbi:uncharacterized protein LOC123007140 [Tribolium madens]|uniref:uncharacterized protein LOC123007140 n=1 Tax=Tribolium madens TaxID=41895 RepID=UPI001CF75AC1|nr:uncharacterized protein LOC123007140 [Tribolium madens]